MQAPQLAQVTPHLALADVDRIVEHRKSCLKVRSPRHRIAYMGHAIKACDRYLCRSISQLVFQAERECPGSVPASFCFHRFSVHANKHPCVISTA